MDFAFFTDSGALPVNEDACQVWPELGLFVACDGLSAKKTGGEFASKTAIETMSRWGSSHRQMIEQVRTKPTRSGREKIQTDLTDAFRECSRAIFQGTLNEPSFQSSCTTLDTLLFVGSHVLLGHVGSGRAYLVRKGQLHQLTEDHTQLAHMRATGKLAFVPEGQHAAYAKRLMRAVGFREDVHPDLMAVELEAGDRFILITDGVWSALEEPDLAMLLLSKGSPQVVMKALIEKVGKGKAKDNFTIVIVDPPAALESGVEAGAELKIKMLGTVPAFAYLDYKELIRVINAGELVKLAAGKEIWHEGDTGSEMMLILNGTVHIMINEKRISTLGKGDVLGEMSMIDAAPRSATAVTAEATNLLAFPRSTLFALFRDERDLAVKFLWGVTMEMNKRLRAASSKVAGSTATAAPPTLAKLDLPFHKGSL